MFSAVSCHQNKSYHVPVTATFAIKISKSKTKSSYNSSFLYSRADWDEFKMELDRELIDCKPEELSLENLEETISKSLIKAANKAIPKSKKKFEIHKLPAPYSQSHCAQKKTQIHL